MMKYQKVKCRDCIHCNINDKICRPESKDCHTEYVLEYTDIFINRERCDFYKGTDMPRKVHVHYDLIGDCYYDAIRIKSGNSPYIHDEYILIEYWDKYESARLLRVLPEIDIYNETFYIYTGLGQRQNDTLYTDTRYEILCGKVIDCAAMDIMARIKKNII